jgi:hypothetical protein
MQDLIEKAQAYRRREDRKSQLFDSLALVFLTLLAIWLNFGKML